MILVDTSVWIDHLRAGDDTLRELLVANRVLVHPFVIGEIALGHFRQRQLILETLDDLPKANVASEAEVLHFVDSHELFGRGIGWIDAHLLAATRLTAGARLWTRDKRVRGTAVALKLAVEPA